MPPKLESLRARFASFSVRAAAIGVTVAIIVAAVLTGGYLSMQRGPFDFTQHQKVSATSVLRLHFPEEMNHDSVEKLLSVPAGLTAERSWRDGVLELKPTAKLTPGKTYVIRADARSLKADGQPLGRNLSFTFDVTGAPVVSAQIPPSGAKSVQTNARIVIVFDRPVVALSQVQDAMGSKKLPSWPVRISPAIGGRWRWIGTTSVQFVPSAPLKLDTAYTVTVPAGIQTVFGDVTEKDFSWTFETERPVMVSTEPEEWNTDTGPSTVVTAHFNQPMDLAGAKDYLMLQENDAAPGPVGTVSYGKIKNPDDTTTTDKTSLIIRPASPLKYQSRYTLEIKAGIRGLDGPLGSFTSALLHFSTVGPMSVTSAAYDSGRLEINFSNPVDSGSLASAIDIKPKLAGLKPEELVTNDWNGNKQLEIYKNFEPSTDYTLTVKTSLADRYSQHPAKPFTYSWTTPRLLPRIFIHPDNNRFSIFERGKAPVYYVNDLNVSGVDVTMGEVPLDVFLRRQQAALNNYSPWYIDPNTEAQNVKTWHVKPGAKTNVWESVPVDTAAKFGAPLKPALYVFDITSPEMDQNGKQLHDQRVFAMTNMGITLKYSGNRALVWVIDLQTGAPVRGAAVEFRSLDGKTPASGSTDKDGFFETPISIADFASGGSYQPQFWVIVRKDDDLAFAGSDWTSGVQPYDFDGVQADFRSPQSAPYRVLSTLYTERPVYKTGDTVFLKGIVRFLDWNGKMTVPAGKNMQVTVTDPSGKQIYDKTLPVSDFGSFNDSLPIDPKAPLGYYNMTAIVSPQTGDLSSAYGSFQVLAYRKPEYKVTVTPETQDYYSGQTVKAEISGQYYFGAPMGAAAVTWRAVSRDYYFNRYADGWYSFGLYGSWCWYNCQGTTAIIAEGHGMLDASGKLQIQFPVNLAEKSLSQVVSVEADITDKNNQVVSSREDVIVHKSKIYVGIRSDDYVVTPGKTAAVSLVTVNPDGTPAQRQSVTVSLYSRVWNTVKQKGVDGAYYYDNQPKDTFIRSVSAVMNESGKGTADVLIDQGGEFSVVASVKDAEGREAKSSTEIYAWSDTYFNWPHSNNDKLEIVTDKPSYKVGDTAKLLVKSPYQGPGVKALVTVERENVITHRVVDVTSNALPIEVPVTEDLLPTAYVSVVVIKPRIGETFNDNGLDTGAPSFKVGYVKLPIDTAPRRLTVNVRTDKDKYLPGETVNVTLETLDPKGNHVPAELSLGAVDLSLLDLTGFKMPDLVETFWGERGLGVFTSNMLTYLMERFKPGSKGGGGGGEEHARGVFKDTAFWKARIVTDKNGLATASFKLPDNLTTWQLLALGSTKSNLFGGNVKNIIETKHVILRPVRPRFAVIGDTVKLGAIVHNYLEEARTFTVSLDGKGFSGSGPQTVTIPKDGDVKVIFDATINDAPAVTMHFLAVTDGARDEITETIPTFRFGVEQTNATAGVTDTEVTETVAVPTRADAPTGALEVKIAPSIAVYLASGLEYLAQYPYGCAEQTVSTFLPNVVLKKLQGFDAFRIVDDAKLEANITAGLEKIYTFQQGDGGFGYWRESVRSYPRLTAYIFYALTVTRGAGYSVDSGVLDKARNYLTDAIHNPDRYGELADPSTRAYILYVLSEDGTTDIALLNNLMKLRETLPIYARAYLAMAYQKAGTSSAKKNASELVQDILGHAQVDARRAEIQEDSAANGGFSMNTNDRTTAIALQAMVRIDPTNALTMKLVRGLLAVRQNGHWDTTQSTVASLLSFIEYIRQTDEMNFDFAAAAAIDDKNVINHAFKKPTLEQIGTTISINDLPRGKTISAKVGKQGPGKLYYDLALSYFYTPDIIQPAEEGMGILREMVPITGSQKGVSVGNTYKVTLTVTVPEQRHFVAIESPLPAGMEAIDLNLATSEQNLYGNAVNRTANSDWWNSALWYFNHIEFRDDQVFLFAEDLPPGVYTYEYLARATTPGTFHLRPAKVSEMYFPETFGQTRGEWLTISE